MTLGIFQPNAKTDLRWRSVLKEYSLGCAAAETIRAALLDRSNFDLAVLLAVSVFLVYALFSFVADNTDLVTLDQVVNDLSGNFHIFDSWRTNSDVITIDKQQCV